MTLVLSGSPAFEASEQADDGSILGDFAAIDALAEEMAEPIEVTFRDLWASTFTPADDRMGREREGRQHG